MVMDFAVFVVQKRQDFVQSPVVFVELSVVKSVNFLNVPVQLVEELGENGVDEVTDFGLGGVEVIVDVLDDFLEVFIVHIEHRPFGDLVRKEGFTELHGINWTGLAGAGLVLTGTNWY